MINIIAFKGKIGSGKTTAALYLINTRQYARLRFADKLKAMLRKLGLTERELDGDLKEVPCELLGGKTPRYAMTTLGTEWGRDMIHSNLWVNALNRSMISLMSTGVTKFVIDDVRFVSEANYIESLKSKYNVLFVGIERGGIKSESTHISETEIDYIFPDHVIYNDDTMESFHRSIDEVVSMYFKGE